MSIIAINVTIGTRFVRTKTLVFLGLFAMLLGWGIRLVSLRCNRWWTLTTLITLRCLVLVTFPLFPFYGASGIGHALLSINLTLWRILLLWERWRRHGGRGC